MYLFRCHMVAHQYYPLLTFAYLQSLHVNKLVNTSTLLAWLNSSSICCFNSSTFSSIPALSCFVNLRAVFIRPFSQRRAERNVLGCRLPILTIDVLSRSVYIPNFMAYSYLYLPSRKIVSRASNNNSTKWLIFIIKLGQQKVNKKKQ